MKLSSAIVATCAAGAMAGPILNKRVYEYETLVVYVTETVTADATPTTTSSSAVVTTSAPAAVFVEPEETPEEEAARLAEEERLRQEQEAAAEAERQRLAEEEEERLRQEEEAAQRAAEEEAARQAAEEAERQRQEQEAAQRAAEEEAARQAAEEAERQRQQEEQEQQEQEQQQQQQEQSQNVDSYAAKALEAHNRARRQHGTPDMSWDGALAGYAKEIAERCVFAHDTSPGGGGYGQNLAWVGGSGDNSGQDRGQTVYDATYNQWYEGEKDAFGSQYGVPSPSAPSGKMIGHFTQVLWKSSTKLGCYTHFCPKGNPISSGLNVWNTVCHYGPAGNVGGHYGDNVLPPQ